MYNVLKWNWKIQFYFFTAKRRVIFCWEIELNEGLYKHKYKKLVRFIVFLYFENRDEHVQSSDENLLNSFKWTLEYWSGTIVSIHRIVSFHTQDSQPYLQILVQWTICLYYSKMNTPEHPLSVAMGSVLWNTFERHLLLLNFKFRSCVSIYSYIPTIFTV